MQVPSAVILEHTPVRLSLRTPFLKILNLLIDLLHCKAMLRFLDFLRELQDRQRLKVPCTRSTLILEISMVIFLKIQVRFLKVLRS